VVAAFRIAKAAGFSRIITFDMGGTSSDVSLVPGAIQRSQQSRIGEFPIRLPMIDINTVGAGGGSIAFVDRGGALRVGPRSAGADPGPACYGRGDSATVTDADLILGRISPEFFLGGKMPLFPERSHAAVERIANRIGKSVEETAAGIIDIANANMEKAIRVISIERGIDPRDYALVSFGGAGGVHAAEIASHMNIGTIVIPKNAGVLSALGLLMADSIKDHSRSLIKPVDRIAEDDLIGAFDELACRAREGMRVEGFPEDRIDLEYSLDLRYLGQSHEITLPYRGYASLAEDFHKAHVRLYTYQQPQQPVEIVNLRVKAVGRRRKLRIPRSRLEAPDPKRAFVKNQTIVFGGKAFPAAVFDRSGLRAGNIIEGPALVADFESTTMLPPAHRLRVDAFYNLIMQRISN
jgi:N-methylhydantoinase A/oxoprolinase/acetone carboxylase beta subunit